MTTRESGVCSCNGEWNVYLQGRVECVATKESGLYTYKGEWNVRPQERVEWQQRRVECVAARESGACSCKRERNVSLQGRVECVAKWENGAYDYKEGGMCRNEGEWSVCLRENRVAKRESRVYGRDFV